MKFRVINDPFNKAFQRMLPKKGIDSLHNHTQSQCRYASMDVTNKNVHKGNFKMITTSYIINNAGAGVGLKIDCPIKLFGNFLNQNSC